MNTELLRRKLMLPLLVLSAGALAWGQAKDDKPAVPVVELPVNRAVLFSSGVGYFEHTGSVEGDAIMRLTFKTDQINDVLKSMVLTDADGGTVTSVTYTSNDPVNRALRSFGVDISGNPSLPQLLSQLRGAQVTLAAPDKIVGSILNVESRTKVIGQPPTQITEHTINLITPGGIRSIPLDSVANLELADPKLREELNQALALLVASRDTERKPVDIKFTGQGKRRVRVGYLIETPIWKTSYRLDLAPVPGKADEKPLLQGWAIVENTSDQDWKAVALSLVSGRPISFVQDLYTPLYLPRPVVTPPQYASLQPRLYDEGIEADRQAARLTEMSEKSKGEATDKDAYYERRLDGTLARQRALKSASAAAPGRPMSPPGLMGPGGGGGFMPANAAAAETFGVAFGAGVQSVAQASNVGEMFRFTIQAPVDMPRRRSAMLPIVNEKVAAERISIYNPNVLAQRPLSGAYLTNSTKLKLLAGPVTVFDGGSYAGDAQLDHLSPGEKRLLSFAIDLDVTIDSSGKSSAQITKIYIDRGVLWIVRTATYTQTYKIKNKADAKRTIIIEYPFSANRKLVEPTTYEEKTPSVHRFRVGVEADKTGEFVVREEEPQHQQIGILDQPATSFEWIMATREIDKSVKDALLKAAAIKQELAGLQKEFDDLNKELNDIRQDQPRLRENLKAVGPAGDLGKTYLATLSDQEKRINELVKNLIPEKKKQLDAKRKELQDYLSNLNVGK